MGARLDCTSYISHFQLRRQLAKPQPVAERIGDLHRAPMAGFLDPRRAYP